MDSMTYPYSVDYNDHFETPRSAYEHILPLLDAVQQPVNNSRTSSRGKTTGAPSCTRRNHIIYDPYYCNGRAKELMQAFGFEKVVHEKRDFYRDIKENSVPRHETFITNPPYSSDHKERCVSYAVDQLRRQPSKGREESAFFILMPNYVAVRNHFRAAIQASDGTDEPKDILYVVPPNPYEYEHPKGTGKDLPPFASIWFCGIPVRKVDAVKEAFRNVHGEHSVGIAQIGDLRSNNSPRLVSTLQELKALGAVPTQKRKNLKQRLKAKRKLEQSSCVQANPHHTSVPTTMTVQMESVQKGNKKSRYRDNTGARKKKRF
jgi:hypothetical protein